MLDADFAVLGETVAQFIHFWMTITPPPSGAAQSAARAKGAERFEGFMQNLGRRLATGDRFLRELSPDFDTLHDDPLSDEVRKERRSKVSIQAHPIYRR